MTAEATTSGTRRPPASFASQVYGLLVVGAALAVVRPGAQSRRSVFLDVFAAAAVYSLAHVYAEVLEKRVHHEGALTRAEKQEIARNGMAIVRATALPFGALAVCWVVRVGAGPSVSVALWTLVGELAVTSWFATGRIRPAGRRALYASTATALGLLLIGLKIVTH